MISFVFPRLVAFEVRYVMSRVEIAVSYLCTSYNMHILLRALLLPV